VFFYLQSIFLTKENVILCLVNIIGKLWVIIIPFGIVISFITIHLFLLIQFEIFNKLITFQLNGHDLWFEGFVYDMDWITLLYSHSYVMQVCPGFEFLQLQSPQMLFLQSPCLDSLTNRLCGKILWWTTECNPKAEYLSPECDGSPGY
jgi:hypothetical protein